MVNLEHKKIVVVGAGTIAYHKIKNLLRYGLHIDVVSPEFHPAIEKLALEGLVTLHQKEVDANDYMDAFLIIAVTNSSIVNDQVARTAASLGKLVVHTGNPELGNCTIPASLVRGKLAISVSTGGASPTLAKNIRNELEEQFDESYEDYLDFLYEVRQYLKSHEPERAVRLKWLKKAADPLYLHHAEERQHLLNQVKKHS
ncbi:precorrin-2 dehydrogenase/sirohydrochlorin ferrochelatase [Bacillus ectoiniformans]|nr:precorrin-2 dehydrogenase/sirohydrochlorin ferrochelatase [Bacillus ectoiniformans]